jgi:protein TonB
MELRCFLFTSDEDIAGTIRLVLAGLDVKGEACPNAVTAAERIANQSFQIVIIDWDHQPEAGLLLSTARQRKASERPITLAIVSDDASVPKALQAGANSILRKPIVVNQAKDTLMTARDLIRAKSEPAPAGAAAAASPATVRPAAPKPSPKPPNLGQPVPARPKETNLRAGEFLHAASSAPGGSFETDSDVSSFSQDQPLPAPIDPLAELETVAAPVAAKKFVEPPPAPEESAVPEKDEPHGLEWHLKQRGINRQAPSSAGAAAPAPAPVAGKPELMGFDQPQSPSVSSRGLGKESSEVHSFSELQAKKELKHAHKEEAELFAHIEAGPADAAEDAPRPPSRIGKRAIAGAVLLAACAVAAAPQAPWHPQMKVLWPKGQRSLHSWLNPQPVTPVQAPAAHEDFGRAGDEYKLPATETIPDATTDPSQIQVVPVVDPTKKPNPDAAAADPAAGQPSTQPAAPADGATPTPAGQTPAPAAQTPENQPAATSARTDAAGVSVVSAPAASTPVRSEVPVQVPAQVPVAVPVAAPPKLVQQTQPRQASVPGNIPSSLKSQLAPNSADPGGVKSPETAMSSIEPVSVAEGGERALLIDQPAIPYPANVKSQGTVVLQVVIGRDGTVQDAKFLQGSLAFARTAIDGVKQWKFKPYTMNGRAVSVQTLLTLTFKPGA